MEKSTNKITTLQIDICGDWKESPRRFRISTESSNLSHNELIAKGVGFLIDQLDKKEVNNEREG